MGERTLEGGCQVSHYTNKEWKAFISESLQLSEQSAMEQHLYDCDACLADYLQINEQSFVIDVPDSSPDQINALLDAMNIESQTDKQKIKLINKPIWQYVIAASLTIALMSSGVFHQVTGVWKQAESGLSKKPESLTESLMNKTLSLLDNLHQTK
jgi:hypothetical protein